MDWQAWLTLVTLAAMIVVLARDIVAPSVVVIGTVVVLLVTGVVDASQAFRGFSNPAPITIAALYVLARAVEKTGAIQPLVALTLGAGRSLRGSLIRLLVPTATASAFLNNTPIVAMLVPQITDWADRRGLSPAYFLMPLAFAAILGGTLTLIGTSTNLVVSGLLESHGLAPLGMFELTPMGLPIALVGLVIIVAGAPLILAARAAPRRSIQDGYREFAVAMEVERGGPLDGKAVGAGGLRSLQGVFLVEIERGRELIAPVAPERTLHGGDVLFFVGRADTIVDLQALRGLTSREREHVREFDTHRHTFFEAVIGPASPLVGKTLKELGFRGTYQAAVIAIHRAGQRVQAKLGGVSLRAGDTLLMLADTGFRDRWRDRGPFLLISQMGGTPPAVTRKAWLVGIIVFGVVAGAAAGVLPVLHGSLLAVFALVGLGVLTPGEARRAVDLDVILVIAGSFGLAAALESSGLAGRGAHHLVDTFGGFGPQGGLIAIVLAMVVLVSIITRNAATILMFPVALSAAQELGVDPRPFAVALALAATASFMTPIAYHLNLMVYGPGGYRFTDYARLGLPLTLAVVIATVVGVPMVWPLQ